jgi:hypothetical protein
MQWAGLCGVTSRQTIQAFLFIARPFENPEYIQDWILKCVGAQLKPATPTLLALHVPLLAELSQNLGEIIGRDAGSLGDFLSESPSRGMACQVTQDSERISSGLRNHLHLSVDDYIH